MMDKKILVVDDEKPIADILEFNLRKEGYEVHCAHDGNEAVEMVEELQPDLILLDIMLPNKDGVEVCREVRKKYDMPIIMLTAKDSEEPISGSSTGKRVLAQGCSLMNSLACLV